MDTGVNCRAPFCRPKPPKAFPDSNTKTLFKLCFAGSGQASPGLDDMKKRGFWTSVSDLLLMFPLTPPVRAVLLEMLCVGTQPSQVRCLHPGHSLSLAGQGKPSLPVFSPGV